MVEGCPHGLRHLGLDITLQRVTGVTDSFLELCQQNIKDMPPGSLLAWRKLMTYTGSCFRPSWDLRV
jgi:hypothetical protein